MKRVLLSLAVIGTVGVAAFNLSSAYFSDTETSSGNTFTAGSLDLKVDNTSYLNGEEHLGTTWDFDDLAGHFFFNFPDLKPNDEGEDTISLHVETNDAWACAELSLTSNNDNSSTEPELSDSDSDEDGTNPWDGEVAQSFQFIFWIDDGNNVLETDEYPAKVLSQGTAIDALDTAWTLADFDENNVGGSVGEGLLAGENYFIGKAWCFGKLSPDPVTAGTGDSPVVDPGVDCDGTGLPNITQTDSVTADIEFTAVQHRNNPGFNCQIKEPLFVEEVLVDTTTPASASSFNILANGKIYILEAIGTYEYWPSCPEFAPCEADAEYSHRPSTSFGPGWIYGDDVFPPAFPAGSLDVMVDGSNVYWGIYNSNHTYKIYYLGDGTTVEFSIFDTFYGDNSGTITVNIYEKP